MLEVGFLLLQHRKSTYDFLDIVCVNINSQQLSTAAKTLVPLIATTAGFNIINTNINNGNASTADATRQPVTSVMCGNTISLVNATATTLPLQIDVLMSNWH